MATIAPDGILLSEWHLLSGHCQTNLSGPAKVAGLKRSGRQLTPLGQGGSAVLFEAIAHPRRLGCPQPGSIQFTLTMPTHRLKPICSDNARISIRRKAANLSN
jgi:hypothetical protein